MDAPSAVSLGLQSLLRGDAEGVVCPVDLYGGEGGFGRNVIGDRDCVIAAGELVVEEQERIALGVWWHERGLPPDGHLDIGRVCEGQPDRPIVGRVGRCSAGVLAVGRERLECRPVLGRR